jgi:hypothetical protein
MSDKFNNDELGRNVLVFLLQEGIVNVTFTKKDGSKRILRATLQQDKIPQQNKPKGDNPWRTKSEEAQAVFDLDNDGWRSFRWDSVVDYEAELM